MKQVDLQRFKLPVSFDPTQQSFDEAAGFNNLAIDYEISGDGHRAIEYYTKALKFFSQTGDLNNKAHVLNNIGGLLKNHGSWQDAYGCFYEVSEIMHENGNWIGEAAALCNLGMILMNLGDFGSMLKFEYQALEVMKNVDNAAQEAACLSEIALALYGLSRTKEAISCLEQGITLLVSRNLSCDASGTSVDDLRDLLQSMQTGNASEIFGPIVLSNAMKAFITATSWHEAWQVFEQYQAQLSVPELETNLREEVIQLRREGARQQASNLQAHLRLLRRANRHYTHSLRKKDQE